MLVMCTLYKKAFLEHFFRTIHITCSNSVSSFYFQLDNLTQKKYHFRKKMLSVKYLVILLFFTFHQSEERSIKIMIPQEYGQNALHKELDVKIIEHFAKEIEYKVKYIATDIVMNETAGKEKSVQQFSSFKES